jgi:cyclophilin family peptidyl-prolyl cis-trans isomerase/HEAT repeat protein
MTVDEELSVSLTEEVTILKNRLSSLLLILTLLQSYSVNSTVRTDTKDSRQELSENNKGLTASIFEAVDKRILDLELFNKALNNKQSKKKQLSIRLNALKGLARIGGKDLLPLVKPFLSNTNNSIRRVAVLAAGQSKTPQANELLWSQLKIEKSSLVRAEIYLALANLTEDNIVSNFLSQKETELSVKKSIYHSLAATLTYNREIKQNYKLVDFHYLINQIAKDDELSAPIAYFLARVPNIEQHILPSQMTDLIISVKTLKNKRLVARLIGKIVKKPDEANREILSWLIEQSKSNDIRLATEAIRAMVSFLYIPQAKIQLGKLHASSNILIAQTALQVLANSSLEGKDIINLFKKQLKSDNSGMVVAAMSGLIRRQVHDDMTWTLKILQHKDNYVKVNFANLIFNKDPKIFSNVLNMMSKDPNPIVANKVKRLLNPAKSDSIKNPTAKFNLAELSSNQTITLKTNIGEIIIKMSSDAPYSAHNFVTLIKQGFYNQSYFMRVIGNFVAQGGDPIGDGEGTSGKNIREELSFLSHTLGSVGMATAGKDTGDSQFFINTSNNIHLDRNYTVFGQVVKGMDVAMKLAHGDQIVEAIVN